MAGKAKKSKRGDVESVTIKRPDGTEITVTGPGAAETAKQILESDRPFKWPDFLSPPQHWPPTPFWVRDGVIS